MKINSHHIISYLEYLNSVGLTITLHCNIINNSKFLQYNYHRNPYCHYIKTVYGKLNECICCQKKVIKKLECGSFFGVCYAGVGEFVYPINNGIVIGFISVSGYICEISKAKLSCFAKNHDIPYNELEELMEKYLISNIPPKSFFDAVINPLVFMLEEYFGNLHDEVSADNKIYHKMLRYITDNCHKKITMRELSDEFNYSVSTLSHLFKKQSGKSLPTYIDDLRINEAKWYLANSDSSVAEIAHFLGYSDSNYFSTVFKHKCGITPKKYRVIEKENSFLHKT